MFARLRALGRLDRKQADLDDEIRFHLDEEAEEQRAAGLTVEEAKLAAKRDFGNVSLIRETTREVWGWASLARLIQDVRYGWRMVRSTPLVSSVAILSLALGIGANTAIFSVVDTLILRPLPVDAPGQLVLLGDESGRRKGWTNPIWEQIQARSNLFEGAFAVSSTRFNLSSRGESEVVDGLWASGRTFDVLGVHALIGRTITEEDDRRAADRMVPSPSSATRSGSGGSAEPPTRSAARSQWSACLTRLSAWRRRSSSVSTSGGPSTSRYHFEP